MEKKEMTLADLHGEYEDKIDIQLSKYQIHQNKECINKIINLCNDWLVEINDVEQGM